MRDVVALARALGFNTSIFTNIDTSPFISYDLSYFFHIYHIFYRVVILNLFWFIKVILLLPVARVFG